MVLIERSVETPRSPSTVQGVWQGQPRGGLVGVTTSKMHQIINVQYLRIPSKILEGASHGEVLCSGRNE
jgi:hypothetical protein